MDISIAKKFSQCKEKLRSLPGGQNTSLKYGEIVLKPIREEEKYLWLANIMKNVESNKISIAKPIKSISGEYIINGYGATQYIQCKFYIKFLKAKLEAASEFHRITKNIKMPSIFKTWSSPWNLATEIAWEERALPKTNNKLVNNTLRKIKKEYKKLDLQKQFIHSDLSGNILFRDRKPVVIDISPEFRPVEYSHTLLITDSIAWYNASVKNFNLLPYNTELKKQLILRAVMFRLCVPLCLSTYNISGFMTELKHFDKILKAI